MRKSAATVQAYQPYFPGPPGPRLCSPNSAPSSQSHFPNHGPHFAGANHYIPPSHGPSPGFYQTAHEPYVPSSQVAYTGYHGSQASVNSSAAYYGYHGTSNPPLYSCSENFQFSAADSAPQKRTCASQQREAFPLDSIPVSSPPFKRANSSSESKRSSSKSSQGKRSFGVSGRNSNVSQPSQRGRKPKTQVKNNQVEPPALQSRKPVAEVASADCVPGVDPQDSILQQRKKPRGRPKLKQKAEAQIEKRVAAVKKGSGSAATTTVPFLSSKRPITEFEEFEHIEQQAKKMCFLSPSKRKGRSQSSQKISGFFTRIRSSSLIKSSIQKLVCGGTSNPNSSSEEQPSSRNAENPTQGTQPTAANVKDAKSILEVGVVRYDFEEVKKTVQNLQADIEQLRVSVAALEYTKIIISPRRPTSSAEDPLNENEDNPMSNENTQPEQPGNNFDIVRSDSSDYQEVEVVERSESPESSREPSLDRFLY